jgi:hypothetical protein
MSRTDDGSTSTTVSDELARTKTHALRVRKRTEADPELFTSCFAPVRQLSACIVTVYAVSALAV